MPFVRCLLSSIRSNAIVFSCLFAWTLFSTSNANAQQWAHKLFSETHHDFGTISRNAKAEFAFELKNSLDGDLHISSARSSCGCTKPIITQDIIKPGQTGSILAQFNTRSFIGQKNAMITVVIDRPYYAEIQLTVTGKIRSDVVTEPGELRFGDLDQGTEKEIPLKISYAGRPDWKITDVRGNNENIEVRMDPPTRQPGGLMTVVLRVRLKSDAPIGDFQDELTIVTNDARSDSFSLPVSGRILAPVAITPQLVSLGDIQEGSVVRQKFIVRAKQPFVIQNIECQDDRFQFQIPKESKNVHIVPFEFRGEIGQGEFRQRIIVKTNMGEAIQAECIISGHVIH